MKYKKIPNNENAIEIDGKVILSFDPKYKEYLKWQKENPDLEKKLVKDLNKEVNNRRLYNNGAPHVKKSESGLREGKATYYDENGVKTLESHYKNGILDGEMRVYRNGILETMETYTDGERTGKYTYFGSDGKKLTEGFYNAGKDNGLKKVWFLGTENLQYTETFNNDILHGSAKYYESDTGKLGSEGNYKNGKKDGVWIFYFKNGNKKWVGNYKDDQISGELIQYEENGIIISKENYEDGKLVGKYEYYHDNGRLRLTGELLDGKDNGEKISYWSNSNKKSVENFKMNIKNGTEEQYYIDGQLSTKGEWSEGYKDKTWVWYYPDGTKMREENFDYKILSSIAEWEEDGNPRSSKSYTGEILNGECILYGKNGNMSRYETYRDGKLHGKFIDYYVNGNKRAEGTIQSEMMVGVWNFWFHNGKKELECEFKLGQISDGATIYHDNGLVKQVIEFSK